MTTSKPDAPGPPVRVRLPDGTWWYVVHLSLWSEVERRYVWTAEPYDVVMSAPAAACSPVDGEDYSSVPTIKDQRP